MPEFTGKGKPNPKMADRDKEMSQPAGKGKHTPEASVREKSFSDLSDLAGAEQALGYRFRDKRLLEICFTHASVTGEESNERLEFLGDAVLELYVTEKLYHSSAAREGELTELRKRYVSRDALSAAEEKLGLLSYLLYSVGEDALKG